MDAFNRMSVATIDAPEFINIHSISPLVSKCEIKVLYVGENRNRSYISKEVAADMAQTLPGTPIVGWYIEDKADFGDHGDQVIIDNEGVKFKKLTKPYGFVAPDSKVWFQKFDDTDEFGNTETREYLMTEGYLWTEQFEECKRVVDCGNPQSMELDEKTLKGHWSTDSNLGVEFFIINDAIFSKLCILGEDVEPCFEGAKVGPAQSGTHFSKDNDFAKTLFSMMQELKYTLNTTIENEGGLPVENEVILDAPVVETEAPAEEFSNEEVVVEEFAKAEDDKKKDEESEDSASENNNEKKNSEEEEDDKKKKEEFACQKDDEEEEKKKDFAKEEDKEEEDKKKKDEEEEYACGDKKKYELLENDYQTLQKEFSLLEEEVKGLREFKANIENEQKDELINSFYMLDDEDKKDVIENKSKYSLDDIEAKLSVICVRKKVNFNLDETEDNDKEAVTTFNLKDTEASTLPAWLQAVEDRRNMNN